MTKEGNAMKKIKYSEPKDFFPKEIRDKYFKQTPKKTGAAKKTAKKKGK